MTLKNKTVYDIAYNNDVSVTIWEETLTDGSKCYSVEVGNVCIECVSEERAKEVFFAIVHNNDLEII